MTVKVKNDVHIKNRPTCTSVVILYVTDGIEMENDH